MKVRIPALALSALSACMLLLAACGGGGGTPTPLPPSGLMVVSDVAPHGGTFIVNGTNLGTSGTAEIGGVTVPTSAWSAGSVTVTVPSTVPDGPQTLTLTNSGGSATVDVFVGVDYPTGTLDELIALNLPKGTAVRLGEGTYSSDAGEVVIDNLSLYGQGKDATIVGVAWPSILMYRADVGEHIVLSRLNLEADAAIFLPSAAVAPAVATEAFSLPASPEEALAQFRARSASLLGRAEVQTTQATSLTFKDMTITQAVAGLFATVNMGGAPVVYPGTVTFENVDIDADASTSAIFSEDDIVVRGSTISAGQAMMASFAGTLTISDTKVTSRAAHASVVAYGTRGLSVTGTTATASDGTVSMASFAPVGGPFVMHADAVVTDNTLVAKRVDTTNTSDGGVEFMFAPGSALVADNKITAYRTVAFEPYAAGVTVRDNTLTVGQASGPLALVSISAAEAEDVRFSGNVVKFVTTGSLLIYGGPSVSVTNNTFTGYSNTGAAAAIEQAGSYAIGVTMTGNSFKDFEQALVIEGDGSSFDGLNVRANSNTFDFTIDAAPKAALIQDLNADDELVIDLTGNVWGTNTDAATVESYVQVNAASITGEPLTLTVAPIATP